MSWLRLGGSERSRPDERWLRHNSEWEHRIPQIIQSMVELSGIEPLTSSLRKGERRNLSDLAKQTKAQKSGKQPDKILIVPLLFPRWLANQRGTDGTSAWGRMGGTYYSSRGFTHCVSCRESPPIACKLSTQIGGRGESHVLVGSNIERMSELCADIRQCSEAISTHSHH
jgi:hypothetical protein